MGEPGDEERKERTERSADTQTMEEIIVVLWCASPLAQHLSSLVWCRERARCKDALACMANQLTHLQERLVSRVSSRNVSSLWEPSHLNYAIPCVEAKHICHCVHCLTSIVNYQYHLPFILWSSTIWLHARFSYLPLHQVSDKHRGWKKKDIFPPSFIIEMHKIWKKSWCERWTTAQVSL